MSGGSSDYGVDDVQVSTANHSVCSSVPKRAGVVGRPTRMEELGSFKKLKSRTRKGFYRMCIYEKYLTMKSTHPHESQKKYKTRPFLRHHGEDGSPVRLDFLFEI